ncbi:MAG TPA: LysR family transcriptional regulator [Bauldia sp.]|nr:LysR family transcriptional regulator [Bauldia sp.]
MELAWLEDFLALVDLGSFSRAADHRNVTQPAFSRRIRHLENWVGAPLFDRSTHTVTLTPAGKHFRLVAEEALRRLYLGREEVREVMDSAAGTLRFASTHVLSLTFFPSWLRRIEARSGLNAAVRLVADNMAACERIMLQGQAQFLLCHHHPAAKTLLESRQFQSLHLSEDLLMPVSAPRADDPHTPRFALPGAPEEQVPHLAYSVESGMGRIVEASQVTSRAAASLRTAFVSHMAGVLVALARDGRGVTWAPLSLIRDDLAAGRLLRAGPESWDVAIEIRVFRPRIRQSAAAERFWSLVIESSKEAAPD